MNSSHTSTQQFSSFTEFRKYREKKARHRNSLIEQQKKNTIETITLKKYNSEPLLEKTQTERLQKNKNEILEKEMAKQILENEGCCAKKKVNLNSIIILLNEQWDEEPDFMIL
eukprot:gene3016-5026_t